MVDKLIRTAVFAGAGASCFAEMPTVNSFLKHVEWPASQGLSAACQEMARRISIYEGTQENQAWPIFDAEKLFGWLELLEKTGGIDDSRVGLPIPNLPAAVPVNALISHLRSEIVRLYGRHAELGVLVGAPHRSLIEVVDRLTPPDEPLYLFTTNYDPIIEQILEGEDSGFLSTGRKLRTCTGFTADRPGRWQPRLFSERPRPKERLIQLVKLHGSATWKRDGANQPLETSWPMPTAHDCLLYFGYKSVPQEEPFITLHTILKNALLRCEAVIVIGFRFGDPYIRELFDFALRANPTLRVVCSLTRSPEPNSALASMMEQFPDRVHVLADSANQPIRFGDPTFADMLEATLRNARQADAVG
jgi:hypothetical protein